MPIMVNMTSTHHPLTIRRARRLLATTLIVGVGLACTTPAGAAERVTVAPGDSLSAIAARFGVSVSALAGANGLHDPNRIVVGQVLTVPRRRASSTRDAPTAATSGLAVRRYRIRRGDSLSGIAARVGVGLRALMRANGIRNPHLIVAGRVLIIPSAPATAPVTPPTAASPSAGAPRIARSAIARLLDAAADRHGVERDLLRAIAWQESGWDQGSVSSAGALGVMQLMPATAAWIAQDLLRRPVDPRAVRDNIEAGAAYVAWLQRQTTDTATAVAAYYQGISSLRSRGHFDDTRAYVRNVLALRGRV